MKVRRFMGIIKRSNNYVCHIKYLAYLVKGSSCISGEILGSLLQRLGSTPLNFVPVVPVDACDVHGISELQCLHQRVFLHLQKISGSQAGNQLTCATLPDLYKCWSITCAEQCSCYGNKVDVHQHDRGINDGKFMLN